MLAIETRYIGPSNYRGARIAVKAETGRMVVHWDHALGVEANHVAAAKAFAEKRNWDGEWQGGGSADGKGYVFTSNRFGNSATFRVWEPDQTAVTPSTAAEMAR